MDNTLQWTLSLLANSCYRIESNLFALITTFEISALNVNTKKIDCGCCAKPKSSFFGSFPYFTFHLPILHIEMKIIQWLVFVFFFKHILSIYNFVHFLTCRLLFLTLKRYTSKDINWSTLVFPKSVGQSRKQSCPKCLPSENFLPRSY